MSSRARLLVACAAVAALAAPAHAQGRCGSAQIGNVTGEEYNTVERRVWPDTLTLEISEPDMCSESEPVGLKVTACDADEAPRVYLVDATRGVLVREGALHTDAYVYITMYCSGSGQAAYDYSEPTNLSKQASHSSFGVATPPSQPLSTVPSDPLVTSSVESISTTSSVSVKPQSDTESENPLNSVQFESRFSSISKDSSLGPLTGRPSQVNIPQIPTQEELSSLGKHRKTSVLENLERYIDSIRLHKNETSVLDQQALFDSYSPLIDKILSSYLKDPMSTWSQQPSPSSTDTTLPSLAKRLSELRPETTPPWLLSRSPAWLNRPTKRPSINWVRQESLPDWSTRKSLSRPRKHLEGYSTDDGEQWRPPYEEDSLLLHSQESLDLSPWWTGNKFVKNPAAYHNEVTPHSPPSPFSIQHLTKKQIRYVPPLYEDYRAMSADWQDLLWKRSSLPKLLLLLQEQEHPPVMKMRCESAHTVEDGEPWWPSAITEHSEDGHWWQQDYSADYTADDSESLYRSDNLRPPSHIAPPYKEQSGSNSPQWLDRTPATELAQTFMTDSSAQWCSKCLPVDSVEEHKEFRPGHSRVSKENPSSPQMFRRPPHEHNTFESARISHNLPNAHTERPVLSSTPRHVLWTKESKSAKSMQEMMTSVEQNERPERMSAAHWSYLSKLLLSHPTFRDSTHIIRI